MFESAIDVCSSHRIVVAYRMFVAASGCLYQPWMFVAATGYL
jgi:hypothetical protein